MGHKADKDGIIRYSQWIPGASDSGPDDEPRSFWERLMREEAAQNARESGAQRKPVVTTKTVLGAPRPEFSPPPAARARPAPAMAFRPRLPQPDPNTKIKVNTMAPTISLMQDRKTEFPSGTTFESGYPTYRPNDLQKQVIKDHLAARGKPTEQVDDLKFVAGLDEDAGFFTQRAFDRAKAVTQGNTVYVQPQEFPDVASFNSDVPFEEAYHSSDFASDGGAGFYRPYALGIVGGVISGTGPYKGIPYEAFAQGAAKEMYESYLRRKREKGK